MVAGASTSHRATPRECHFFWKESKVQRDNGGRIEGVFLPCFQLAADALYLRKSIGYLRCDHFSMIKRSPA